ncbi:MAG: type II toxin-antitoxin system Phd/YefM family antitoxin [Chloroflexaceae bacterium]
MVDLKKYTLDVDLKQGVVPISKAASSLAALIKRSRANHQPIIVTQKGYPTGVILDVELFTALRQLADLHLQQEGEAEVNDGAGASPEN